MAAERTRETEQATPAQNLTLDWGRLPTRFGPVLIAVNGAQVLRVAFGEDEEDLQLRYPAALLQKCTAGDALRLIQAVAALVDQPEQPHTLDLAPFGTDFQQRVWKALQAIPAGETRSYAQIAAAVGAPKAVRAVGSAIGANPVAVLIPCHRVMRSDGGLGGYAWGVETKRQLLAHEAGQA